jgi:hypothetical protein
MRKRRRRPILGWILLLLLLIIVVVAIFGLEYLGGERPQQTVEQPVNMPGSGEKAG